jgi:hypothetical protein
MENPMSAMNMHNLKGRTRFASLIRNIDESDTFAIFYNMNEKGQRVYTDPTRSSMNRFYRAASNGLVNARTTYEVRTEQVIVRMTRNA